MCAEKDFKRLTKKVVFAKARVENYTKAVIKNCAESKVARASFTRRQRDQMMLEYKVAQKFQKWPKM